MRKNLIGLTLLWCVGCTQVPQWDTARWQAAETELENAITQIELTGAAGELATLAKEQAAAALDYKLSTLSKSERIKLLIEQAEWQHWAERRNAQSMGDGSIAQMLRHGREEKRLKNRFLELTVLEEIRHAFIAMRNAPVRYQGKRYSLWHGELDIRTPADKWEEGVLKSETIAQLNIPFCRKVVIGKDTYWIGIVEPTNYGVMSSFSEGTESNLCIWHNGKNIGNHLIGKRITVQNIAISQGMIKVSFLDQGSKLNQKEFDFQAPNDNPVFLHHWTTE